MLIDMMKGSKDSVSQKSTGEPEGRTLIITTSLGLALPLLRPRTLSLGQANTPYSIASRTEVGRGVVGVVALAGNWK